MELLALEGKIKEKTYGKQKIYFADQVGFLFRECFEFCKKFAECNHLCPSFPQSQFKDVNDADLKAMDHEISALCAEVQSVTQSCRELDAGVDSGPWVYFFEVFSLYIYL